MSSPRPKIVLDEQSFQGLLAAAFTIQDYLDRDAVDWSDLPSEPPPARPRPPKLCAQCGLPLAKEGAPCAACGAEPLRAGEHLQQLWASMWQVSQERGLAPQPRKAPVPPADASTEHQLDFRTHKPSSTIGSASEPALAAEESMRPFPPDHVHDHASRHEFALDPEVETKPDSSGIELQNPDKPWPSPRPHDSLLSVPQSGSRAAVVLREAALPATTRRTNSPTPSPHRRTCCHRIPLPGLQPCGRGSVRSALICILE